MNILSKNELKAIKGGDESIPGADDGGGSCLYCTVREGAGSGGCWYRRDTSIPAGEACKTIYPSSAGNAYYADCNSGCTMN